jgi:hypothetical protein
MAATGRNRCEAAVKQRAASGYVPSHEFGGPLRGKTAADRTQPFHGLILGRQAGRPAIQDIQHFALTIDCHKPNGLKRTATFFVMTQTSSQTSTQSKTPTC